MWKVVNKKTSVAIKSGFDSESDAKDWMSERFEEEEEAQFECEEMDDEEEANFLDEHASTTAIMKQASKGFGFNLNQDDEDDEELLDNYDDQEEED